ncbi:MAG: sulfatase activating formylglycine-generating enzyme [Chitinophagales bacterium]|jgi:formylglycine-generating enzyme required for sulfatase activity
MKKQQSKPTIKSHVQRGLLALSALLLSQTAVAHNKVVVIPMAGDDIPAISHPVATTFTNSIGMQFNTLPAGSFTMGSPLGEPGRSSNEAEHTVTLTQAFGMQVTEVTNAQWNDVIVDAALGINPSSSHPGDNNYPVERVTWYDAVFFANQLSIAEGLSSCYTFSGSSGIAGSTLTISTVTQVASCTGYRLPTEAEWEYAARAGTTKAYANPVGFDAADTETGVGFNGNLHAMGWYSYNRVMDNGSAVPAYGDGTKPVAKKQANAWGLYDMHGNVFEWNWDRFADYTGNATNPSGPASGSFRVVRGGSWFDVASLTRSAIRGSPSPSNRFSSFGFRLVLPQVQ